MPFYLVTHTSLVEAEDETSAAQKAVAKVQSGGRFKVTVKSDEATSSHIDVEAWPQEYCANWPPLQEPADPPTPRAAQTSVPVGMENPSLVKRVFWRVLGFAKPSGSK